MELVLIVLLLAGLCWLLFTASQNKTNHARSAQRQWRKGVSEQLGLVDVVHSGMTLGVNVHRRALAVIKPNGRGKWIPFDAVAGVELTPFYTRIEEGTSETSTRRGSQIVGAGIGAALAGPAGLVVGGLSGASRTESFSSSSEHLSDMEFKLRLLSDEEPLLKLRFSQNIDFDPVARQFEGGLDNLKRIAARLATDLEQRAAPVSPTHHVAFDEFSVAAKPQMTEGWWSKTFG